MDHVIETVDLRKEFPDVLAVDGLNIKVRRGEVFGFLGPNGAGKTTAIRMMVGLLKPTSGSVLIDGEDVASATFELKGKIGICPQDIVLWEGLTARENLVFMADMYGVPRATSRTRAESLLEEMGLTKKAKSFVRDLSGGMKRRLNVAMALMHDPEIVVLDEPTAGLDPQSRVRVADYIGKLSEADKTVILTTHLMEIADKLSDRVAVIDHGKLLVVDPPERLKDTVGTGDVLEIHLTDENKVSDAIGAIETVEGIDSAAPVDGVIAVRALDMVGKLQRLFNTLEERKIEISNVSLRKNTLEDVFITLTGRGLREG
ncbi:MAG: ATP-binding cassette domain-containing protein [Thermoplasmata archaeon]|nr:ATP-binding cassette domain-containing protein [Thermoplasmata archaeon]